MVKLKDALKNEEEAKKTTELNAINRSLKFLIAQLEEYLQTIHPANYNQGYSEIFDSPILSDEIVEIYLKENEQPEESLVLNFNYTSTVEHYFKPGLHNLSPNTINVNYIYGRLGDDSNPLIFGFGDELDASYLEMEHERTKGFFEHIKSFWYFKTSNYHNLIRFIDAKPFQACILGHSCGLSDRTMLNMIFEHDNCKSIKIYYYGEKNGPNNFRALTEEISRHFRDKVKMRKRIVPFDKSVPMPQIQINSKSIL